MPMSFYPRLSQAAQLLPVLREHLADAAAHVSLPTGLVIDLLPIVENGLFGYELVPNRSPQTYLTIGSDDRGVPVMRRSLYCTATPSALRMASINGRFPSQHELDARYHIEQQDTCFRDWSSAAEALWDELAALFADGSPRSIVIQHDLHRGLDVALATAHAHLTDVDPRIVFCGVPNEAQYGFALRRGRGERGQLTAWPPGRWELRWDSPMGSVHDSWASVPAGCDTTRGWAFAGPTTCSGTLPLGIRAAVDTGASYRARR
jgi:hypothetical protein